jgi:hypothetical protein
MGQLFYSKNERLFRTKLNTNILVVSIINKYLEYVRLYIGWVVENLICKISSIANYALLQDISCEKLEKSYFY